MLTKEEGSDYATDLFMVPTTDILTDDKKMHIPKISSVGLRTEVS